MDEVRQVSRPATTGSQKSSVYDMGIGDYISCVYDLPPGGTVGVLRQLGCSIVDNDSYAGVQSGTGASFPFYFIKVAKGLLISDRIVHHSISWMTLNQQSWIQGISQRNQRFCDDATISDEYVLRSLTGGAGLQEPSGAWPTGNEWDLYLVGSDLQGTITKGDDNVWHWKNIWSFMQDTCLNGIRLHDDTQSSASKYRTMRGHSSANGLSGTILSAVLDTGGFRPVLEFREV